MAPRAKDAYTPQEIILQAVERVTSRGGKLIMEGETDEAMQLFELAKSVMEVVNDYDAKALEG